MKLISNDRELWVQISEAGGVVSNLADLSGLIREEAMNVNLNGMNESQRRDLARIDAGLFAIEQLLHQLYRELAQMQSRLARSDVAAA